MGECLFIRIHRGDFTRLTTRGITSESGRLSYLPARLATNRKVPPDAPSKPVLPSHSLPALQTDPIQISILSLMYVHIVHLCGRLFRGVIAVTTMRVRSA